MSSDPSHYPQHPLWQAFVAWMNVYADSVDWEETPEYWKPIWATFEAGAEAAGGAMTNTNKAPEQRGL